MAKNLALCLLLCIMFGSCVTYYNIGRTSVSSQDICTADECVPYSVGKEVNFNKVKFSPKIPIKAGSTDLDVANSILGRIVDTRVSIPQLTECSGDSQIVFSINDIESLGTKSGSEFEIGETRSLNIDVNAEVNADVKELISKGIDKNKIEQAKAEIKAAYDNLNQKTLKIKGKYSEFALSDRALNSFVRKQEFAQCRSDIEGTSKRIVTAIGITTFEYSYRGNSISELASSLNANLKTIGINVDLGVKLENRIEKEVVMGGKDVFQILSWREAKFEDNQLRD